MSANVTTPLPPNWRCVPIRYLCECLDGRRVPLNTNQRSPIQGDYPYWGANGVVDSIQEFIFDEPLVLVGEDGAPFFDKTKSVAFFVNEKVWVNNHIHVLRPGPHCSAQFLTHALNAVDYHPWIEGSTRDKLTQDKMGSIKIPLPPISVQNSIASFLDRETKRLDELVRAKEGLMQLVAEKRRALITHAVTNGLNSNAPLRNSGIPWLGLIPEHWEIERCKWLLTERDERSTTGEEEMLTVSHITGVTPRSEKEVNMFEAETNEGYKLCQAGDLVINTLWAWMGAMGTARVPGMVSPAYNVYTPGPRLTSDYVDALVRIPVFAQEAIRFSKGVWSSRLRLYPEGLYEIWFPVPPLSEQRAIVAHIATETAKLDALRASAERTIRLLKERRSALISAAVTGKIQIPDSP